MIRVARRFHRSISLTLDWGRPEALRGYLVSPLVRTCGERFLTELTHRGGTRTWSIVGPYGTGKSAFVLFFSTLLASGGQERATLFRRLGGNADLARSFGQAHPRAWMPVLVVGERAPLLVAVLKALYQAVLDARPSTRGRPPQVEGALREMLVQLEAGQLASGSEVMAMIDDVAAYAANRHSGLLFVFDELGKFLEHAAHEPTRSDIYFLQQLAERASRSSSFPLAVITVLHQSFSLYAEGLPERERQEWQKVQGRYDEVPFLEPVDHLVRLAGCAIEKTADTGAQLTLDHRSALASLRTLLRGEHVPLIEALKETLPLHPVVATLLAPIFRGPLAQNERSLFAFLASTEPGGFQAYLSQTEGCPTELYGIGQLYEYVSCVLAARASRGRHERVFGLADRALARITGKDGGEAALVVKALTLLERFGEDAGLLSDVSTIALALGFAESVVEGHLKGLDRFVVHRQFSDTYHLWDGSDVDLERELAAARQVVEHSGNVAGVLERRIALRPVVAGRHLHQTGTLRYLEPRLVEEGAFDGGLAPEDSANGLIVYVLPRSERASRELADKLRDPEFRKDALPHPATVVAVANDATRMREQALSLLALDQALSSSKALRVDPVARRELELQLNVASNRLLATLGHSFGWGSVASQSHARWFTARGGECPAPSRLSRLASDVMDTTFLRAPKIHNELLNRSSLSAQAAKARRVLIEAMIEQADQENLGFVGHPPALSMYLSVLKESGMHEPEEPPYWRRPEGAHAVVWDEMLRVLELRDSAMRVDELFEYFGRPPFGLREGVLPVLLVGLLLGRPDRITLFEDGSLVPMVETEVAERLLRRPKTFAVRAFAATEGRERVLRALLKRLPSKASDEPTVLNATTALLRKIRRLSDYARNTNNVTRVAKRVRTAVLTARDPHDLLFHRLPGELEVSGAVEADPLAYVNALMGALEELDNAEDELIQRLYHRILKTFGARDQAEVTARCRELPETGLADLVAGLKLRAQDDMPRLEWVFSIATFLVHRPPDKWRDKDEAAFDLKLREVARLARRYEQVARQNWSEGIPRLLVSVLNNDGSEVSDIAVVRDGEDAGVRALADSIVKVAVDNNLNRDQVLRAIALILATPDVEQERPSA